MELSKKAKEARRKYHREYQKQHKDKLKVYQAKYWEKKAQEMEDNQA